MLPTYLTEKLECKSYTLLPMVRKYMRCGTGFIRYPDKRQTIHISTSLRGADCPVLVGTEGFEPSTVGFVSPRLYQLSYASQNRPLQGHIVERCEGNCIMSPLLHFSRLARSNRTSSPCLGSCRQVQVSYSFLRTVMV